MVFRKNKIKLAALAGISLSVVSLLVHLFLTNYSAGDFQYGFVVDDLYKVGQRIGNRRLWGSVSVLEDLQPYSNPGTDYPAPKDQNGFIFAKIHGSFDRIRASICDLVAISRLLNATLVLPEFQQSLRSKGISPKFKSFSYLYNEEQFIAALINDVAVVKNLPKDLRDARKKTKFPTFSPPHSASPSYYIEEVLPKLKTSKVVGLLITGGGCLESILPSSMVEYQRLRCRVAFHALQFRPEIQSLGKQMVKRLRAFDRFYLAYHPGLVRETLAFNGCAELFQDVHTKLIQYRRGQMIKRGIVHEELDIDSMARRRNGSCPLMPEEVGLLLRALGYPEKTIIYLGGSEIFGGQRVLVPLRAMYTNLVDRTTLCSKKELSDLVGPEYPLPRTLPQLPPAKSKEQLLKEWKRDGPWPRPLPPPPARPFYLHEHEGWYGWVADADKEPDPLPTDLRMRAHRLLWDALDYYVSVEADAFFPGFHSDGSRWPDFSSLVMGHRLYQVASGITYRPNRKALASLFDTIQDHLYHPPRNWTALARDHLNKSLGIDGLLEAAHRSKPSSFLSPGRTSRSPCVGNMQKCSKGELLYGSVGECPKWMMINSFATVSTYQKGEDVEEGEVVEDSGGGDSERQSESDGPTFDPDDDDYYPNLDHGIIISYTVHSLEGIHYRSHAKCLSES